MNYFAHETTVIDEGCEIGNGTKIWHFFTYYVRLQHR